MFVKEIMNEIEVQSYEKFMKNYSNLEKTEKNFLKNGLYIL